MLGREVESVLETEVSKTSTTTGRDVSSNESDKINEGYVERKGLV